MSQSRVPIEIKWQFWRLLPHDLTDELLEERSAMNIAAGDSSFAAAQYPMESSEIASPSESTRIDADLSGLWQTRMGSTDSTSISATRGEEPTLDVAWRETGAKLQALQAPSIATSDADQWRVASIVDGFEREVIDGLEAETVSIHAFDLAMGSLL